jgi:hypothetical protein
MRKFETHLNDPSPEPGFHLKMECKTAAEWSVPLNGI